MKRYQDQLFSAIISVMKQGGFFKKTVRDVSLGGQTVLVRADYNVPLAADGSIADDFRISSSLETIHYLLRRGAKVVIMSHMGRPDGRDQALSLEVVAEHLQQLLGKNVIFVDDVVGDKVKMTIKKAPARSVILLENLRYYKEEEANNDDFARRIARDTGARYLVQDGFGVVHRAHASTEAITHWLPGLAGLLLEKEYTAISSVMDNPDRPLVAILGGAKVSDKLPLIKAFEVVADQILIGGAMANTVLASRGLTMGKSKIEPGQEAQITEIYDLAKKTVGEDRVDDFLVLPTDVAVASTFESSAARRSVAVDRVMPSDYALDIGDATIEQFVSKIEAAKTVIWNGTMGYAEFANFAHGSARVAMALATHPNIVSVIGGGDTADFALHWDAKQGGSFGHVSTGGGASLELMSGQKLPGVEALLDA